MADLFKHNKMLLATGEYSDFKILCGSRHFKVHRSIICPPSTFLQNLCASAFKEGIAGHASLPDIDPDVFEKVLDFFYTQTYDDYDFVRAEAVAVDLDQSSVQVDCHKLSLRDADRDTSSVPSLESIDAISPENYPSEEASVESPSLLLNVRLYNLAEYLQAADLKQEALVRCICILDQTFDPKGCFDGIKEALSEANDYDLELKRRVFRSCMKWMRSVASCPELEKLLMESEPIAWTLLKEERKDRERDDVSHRKEVIELLDENHMLKTTISARGLKIKDLDGRIDLADLLSRRHSSCRHCGHTFGAEFEKATQLLRCKACRTRHRSYD